MRDIRSISRGMSSWWNEEIDIQTLRPKRKPDGQVGQTGPYDNDTKADEKFAETLEKAAQFTAVSREVARGYDAHTGKNQTPSRLSFQSSNFKYDDSQAKK